MKNFIDRPVISTLLKILSIVTMLGASSVYGAASLGEINKRIEKLEKENQTLKEQVVKNKKSIAKTSKRNKKRLSSLKRMISNEADRLRINGFMSAGIVKGEGDYKYGSKEKHVDFSEGLNFRSDSVVGLQFNYSVTEKTNAIVQLVATGTEKFDIQAEWAYLRHHFTDDIHLTLGRFRTPVYYLSETIEVGFTYPMVRPATEVYISEITSVEGVSLNKDFSWGNHRLSLRYDVFGTSTDLTDVEDGRGLLAEYEYGYITTRALYLRNNVEIKGIDLPIKRNRLYSLAMVYDDGTWLSTIEAVRTDPASGPFYSYDAFVGMFARKFGKWTPHLSLATIYSGERNDDPLAYASRGDENVSVFASPTIRFSGDSVTSGVRYDLSSKIAVKFEATHFINGEEEDDGMGGVNTSLGYLTGDGPSDEDDDLVVYSFVVDAVF